MEILLCLTRCKTNTEMKPRAQRHMTTLCPTPTTPTTSIVQHAVLVYRSDPSSSIVLFVYGPTYCPDTGHMEVQLVIP